MPAFIIADVDVKDMDAYRKSGYLENTPKIAAGFGGKYRARGGDTDLVEGGWSPARIIIIEFPDMTSARAFYQSKEYAPWAKVRQGLAISKIIAVDGVETVEIET